MTTRHWTNGKHLALATALTVGVTGWVLADPILHEYFDFDPAAPEADAPAEVAANGAPATGTDTAPSRTGRTNDAQQGAGDGEDSYELDGNTTRPDEVGYEDPFTPSIPPFKRLFAYDSVDARFELVVKDPRLGELPVRDVPIHAGFDQFFGDIEVSLDPATPMRIPSVGPGALVLAAKLEPAAPFHLRRDGADNWFLLGETKGSARLRVHLAIDRAVFGSAYGDPEWRALAHFVPDLPEPVAERGRAVAREIGVDRSLRPQQAVTRLVAHFRSFAPSEDLPVSADRGALYREITLSRKGVCRHRAYAFTVTALSLGLPTRFVRNEAHAWVELFDTALWHRIDLGGAAGEMQFAAAVDVAHEPPTDPFDWPPGSESASDMTDDALHGQARSGGAGSLSSDEAAPSSPDTAPSPSSRAAEPLRSTPSATAAPFPEAAPESSPAESPSADGPGEDEERLDVALEPHADQVAQGGRVQLAGRVQGASGACALVRVDVVLDGEERTIPVGSLVTDAHGAYQGAITLPRSVPVGDYELRVVPQASADCRAAPN